jgi:DNA-binding IclR family transcriptional regulator
VLLAFSGEQGALYERIRRLGYHFTAGERDPQVASVACPVLGANRSLIGCVVVSGPIARFAPAVRRRHLRALQKATAALSLQLSSASVDDLPAARRAARVTGGTIE